MSVLVLKAPKRPTLEALAAQLTVCAAGLAGGDAKAAKGKDEVRLKIATAPGTPLCLIIGGVQIREPVAICRGLVAADAKRKLEPKKLPKQTAVDSIVEACQPILDAVRGQDSKTLKHALIVLNQLAATIPNGCNGIGGTKGITLADIFCFVAAYSVYGPGGRKASQQILPADAPLAQWTSRAASTWAKAGLEMVNVSGVADLDLTTAKASESPSAVAAKAASVTAKQGKKTKSFDVAWKPTVPAGHTPYSWPKRKKKVAGKTGGSGRAPPAHTATAAVKDPDEWKSLSNQSKDRKSKPRLPVKGRKNILITSALPYVNNVPHLGNIIGCVLSADVYARFCRIRGYNSIYICGTDEYGTTTEMKAYQEGLTEQQICDKYHAIHADIYKWFNIDFDHFGRTTTSQQTQIAQDIYKRAKANGFILEQETKQLYDAKLDKFLADRYVEGVCPKCGYEKARGDQCDKCGSIDYNTVDLKNPVSVLTGETPVPKDSKHLYLDLPKVSARLDEYIKEAQRKGLWTGNAKAETHSWIHKRGLLPRCITRDLKWGTPVPEKGYEDKVFYVWFDAPIGYISITANYTKDWEKWWKSDDVRLVQFMGKDNIPFHTVIFPCTLLAANNQSNSKDNYTLLDSISVCDYLQYEGGLKFSKSRGTGVFGNHVKETGIPPAVWRYYLLSMRPETNDTEFSWDSLMERTNGELIANFGNFVNRCMSFLGKMGGVVPPVAMISRDVEFFGKVNSLVEEYVDCMERIQMRDGLKRLLDISRLGNQLLQAEAPWALQKQGDFVRTDSVLGICVNLVWLLAVLAQPFIPSTTEHICQQLNVPVATLFLPSESKKGTFKSKYGPPCKTWAEAKKKGGMFVGHKIGKAKPLFARIEPESIEKFRKAYGGAAAASSKPWPLNVVVARIKSIDAHPKAEHLAVLQADLGPGRGDRQIVSGIWKDYKDPKTELENKLVLVVENVPSSKFQGVKTQGLVLCATGPNTEAKKRVLVVGAGAPSKDAELIGVPLAPVGMAPCKKKFKPKEFAEKIELTVDQNGNLIFDKIEVRSALKGVTIPTLADSVKGGKVVI
eukprot:CAMPEP_0114515024 /NCGR_PEP_ID=MMETSP0109-20121206/16487_1 /TAXON_ID=29199 /ORGANISM="Chlorarachnion reptans, Strain CCCM449" /LENGTH=1066 /DNA_ID=CAMNT_0001695145 /DNA_START=43 /DNA_END=3243 /DNA_ORIENTATION=+